MSWGVNPESMKVIEGGLEFHCQGFKHAGKVQIVLDEGKDLFEVHLISENGEKIKTIEDVFLDNLVSVIDENIEKRKITRKEYAENTELLKKYVCMIFWDNRKWRICEK